MTRRSVLKWAALITAGAGILTGSKNELAFARGLTTSKNDSARMTNSLNWSGLDWICVRSFETRGFSKKGVYQ